MHPFERLRPDTLRTLTVALFAAWAALTVLIVAVVPLDDVARIAQLASADSAARANELLAAWPEGTVRSAAFLLGFDYLYDLVHNNAVAAVCIWGAHFRGGRALTAARTAAWALWFCTVLNVPENSIFLKVLAGEASDAAVWLASWIVHVRFIVLWSGFAFAAINLVLGGRRGLKR